MKRNFVIIAVVLVVLTVSAYAANVVIENLNQASQFEHVVDESLLTNSELILSENIALKQLKSNMDKGENVDSQITKYAYFISVLNPTTEEKNYIDSLIKKGYDAEALIEIYEFWLDTAEDINIIEEVYSYNPNDEEVEYWIENAFISLSNEGKTINMFSDLTFEEVKEYYYDYGISPDDILVAGRMSRKGVRDAETIIQSRMNGETWYEIADDIYNLSSDSTVNLMSENKPYTEIDDGCEILSCIRMSRTTGNDINTYLNDLSKGESIIEKQLINEDELMEDSLIQLEAQNLLSESVK